MELFDFHIYENIKKYFILAEICGLLSIGVWAKNSWFMSMGF